MSPLDRMKLTELSLILIIFISNTDANKAWNVDVMSNINATLHSDVNVPCTFDHSKNGSTEFYWKIVGNISHHTFDLDTNAFIFHPNDSYVLEEYRGKTFLTGNQKAGNCSLLIRNINHDVHKMYLRANHNSQMYSFKQAEVNIHVSETETSSFMFVKIFAPIAAVLLLLIILVAGIIWHKKHQRVHPLTREASGYYVNFRRSSLKDSREASTKHQDEPLPQVKNMDEPVYENFEPPMCYTGGLDQTGNIYGNVDLSKS
ncbi:uncharacterized protein LOC143008828 isoform X2 [Genypterus blacodes]|uniref:uncharacterized protein LOC143008828 isoform X2 n=1 Tax=Genypterus blacodes TaxID=154954 RepID=UPI003F76709A